jgi:hypothetical protein
MAVTWTLSEQLVSCVGQGGGWGVTCGERSPLAAVAGVGGVGDLLVFLGQVLGQGAQGPWSSPCFRHPTIEVRGPGGGGEGRGGQIGSAQCTRAWRSGTGRAVGGWGRT